MHPHQFLFVTGALYNISVIFAAVSNNFFTSPNMLVTDFNIVITTPFTAVLMLSTYVFLQHHSSSSSSNTGKLLS